MTSIPDLLFEIAPFLDTRSHLACLQVNRLWHTVFTPYFWSSINDHEWPWCILLQPLDSCRATNNTPQRGAFNPGVRRFQQLLEKNQEHVRRMVINFDSLLVIAFEARLTGLTHLWIWGNFMTPRKHGLFKYDLHPTAMKGSAGKDDDDDSGELRLSRVVDNNLIPESLFCQLPEMTYHLSLPHAMDFTQKCWHLVLDNVKTLRSLRFVKASMQTLLPLAPSGSTTNYPYLSKDSMEFLVGVLGRMEGKLEEVQLGRQAEEFLLQFIGRPRGLGWGIGQDGGGGRFLENDNIDSSQHDSNINTTVEKLTLYKLISVSCLRDLILAFPNLQELCGGNHADLPLGSSMAAIKPVAVSNIKHLTGLTGQWHAFRYNIRMPLLKSMGPGVILKNVEDLMQVLQECPELERLEVEDMRGIDDQLAIDYVRVHTLRDLENCGGGLEGSGGDCGYGGELITAPGMEWKIRELTIRQSQLRPFTMPQLLCRMPSLVILELESISREAVKVIGETCWRTLERVRFNLREVCFEEMDVLLRRCERLKSIRGVGLAVDESDIGVDGGWGCLGMEELQIEIHNVPRLAPRQEQLLREQHSNGGDGVSEDRMKEYEEALAEQERCDAVRHRVLDQLSRLQELRLLDLSFKPSVYKKYQTRFCLGSSQRRQDRIPLCVHPVPNSLSLTLSCPPPHNNYTTTLAVTGLEQLATLKKLETIGFKAKDHGIGEAEVRWMSESWPRLKTVLGMAGVRYKGHGTGHQDCRCLDEDVLPMRVRGLFARLVKGVVFPQEY
ncbi:hypothetical protein BGZ91_003531 [Linnemannia elongata]|nr:hypothetical protein BGZ91_003531 [Linnemannia elongata]